MEPLVRNMSYDYSSDRASHRYSYRICTWDEVPRWTRPGLITPIVNALR